MRISQAIYQLDEGDKQLIIEIDGYEFWTFTKYTILEMGYATYLSQNLTPEIEEWIREHGESIPSEHIREQFMLESGNGMLITSDPVLFTLAYECWWSESKGTKLSCNVPLPIPLVSEATEIMRNRKILNDFNLKYRGTIPNELLRLVSK